MSDFGVFFREFVRSPLTTASAVPSSKALAEQMVAVVPERGEPVVVELGPGTGAFTEIIRSRLDGRGRHLAVELNPRLAEILGKRFPEVEVIVSDAERLPELLADRGVAADVVISGLPWAAYRGRLTEAVAAAMDPAGVFTQFTYTWTRWARPSRRQLAQFRRSFEEVLVSRTIWRNVPPALVHVMRRPRTV